MHEFWTLPTANMTYIKSQNCTNMVIGEHEIQTIEVVLNVLLFLLLTFDVFSPHKCTSLIIFEQVICPSMLKFELCMTIPVYIFTFKSFDFGHLDSWNFLTLKRCHPYVEIYHKRCRYSWTRCWIDLNWFKPLWEVSASAIRGSTLVSYVCNVCTSVATPLIGFRGPMIKVWKKELTLLWWHLTRKRKRKRKKESK